MGAFKANVVFFHRFYFVIEEYIHMYFLERLSKYLRVNALCTPNDTCQLLITENIPLKLLWNQS